MAAEIVCLADYRLQKARVRFTFDPVVFMRSWWDFMAGVRP